MPDLPHSIELHDSVVVAANREDERFVIRLSPAYVHYEGKGWLQDAEIIIGSAEIESCEPNLPGRLDDGKLVTRDGPYHNLLMLPLRVNGPLTMNFDFASGRAIRLKSNSVEVHLLGDPKYLEDVT